MSVATTLQSPAKAKEKRQYLVDFEQLSATNQDGYGLVCVGSETNVDVKGVVSKSVRMPECW